MVCGPLKGHSMYIDIQHVCGVKISWGSNSRNEHLKRLLGRRWSNNEKKKKEVETCCSRDIIFATLLEILKSVNFLIKNNIPNHWSVKALSQ